MKIAIAQINPTVGDLSFNQKIMLAFAQKAKDQGAQLVVFPELSLMGYPPKDLLHRHDFLTAAKLALLELSQALPLPALVGTSIVEHELAAPYNVAALCEHGSYTVVARKILLPNYNVFDEKRYFSSPSNPACNVINFLGKNLLISICEDGWSSVLYDGDKKYTFDPIALGIKNHNNVHCIINMSASPYTVAKPQVRENLFCSMAKTHQVPVLLAAQVGANDQLLFDGHSLVIDRRGLIQKRTITAQEDLLIFDDEEAPQHTKCPPRRDGAQELLLVLAMGIRDYVEKSGAKGVIIGLSGGIDSALCAWLCVEALGKERVRLVYLPSQFSTTSSHDDAALLAQNLGVKLEIFSIEEAVQKFRDLLPKATDQTKDIVDQNLQARVRGLILMALSNSTGHLMVATSNKSELAVGYATLYGDMCGAFSAIGDIYKTQVFELAKHINKNSEIIPYSTIIKAPSAELKHNQKDNDTLPDYIDLDNILFNFIELEKSAQAIALATGLPPSLVNSVITMVNHSEYKRRQGPFAFMVSEKVFGDARRLPLAKRSDFMMR